MTKVDEIYISNSNEIRQQEWEVDNRAKWKDGSPIATRRITQVFNKVNLQEGFPILTLREINWKAAFDEIVWIYFKLSNDTKELNSKIWDSWKDSEDKIHKAYGYQIAKPTMGFKSQMHYILNEIKTNPESRRIFMNMFDVKDQKEKSEKSLIECAYAVHLTVRHRKYLDLSLIQRSGDEHTAAGFGGWNTVQYAFLQHAIAKECNLEVGNFAHFIQDLHEYNKYNEVGEELIRRHNSPDYIKENNVRIKIADKPIWDLTSDDVELIGYEHLGKLKIPDIAV